ncbi:unnamed protein product [Phytophthora fragariaefolia]|uniref:Unnamed protein product n=1 Tax=Phytophthora fragariaefolia TaxID=1490495 RepID=A0A9W6WVS3_9STRA|nr:unnamed protein product [Phytophthora fragariaefolia]
MSLHDLAPEDTKRALATAINLTYIRKSNLSLSANNALFIRLIRAKPSEEQGLSLFPDKDSFITCPINDVAMALAMQILSSASLLNRTLSTTSDDTDLPINIDQTRLVDVLLHCVDDSDHERLETPAPTRRRRATPLKLQGYVTRVLKGADANQAKANITANLSSHSFHRGGAQHANGDPTLSAQWIFDRGNWSMTATSKGFACFFNTTTEDRKVSKVLNNRKSNDQPKIPSLTSREDTKASLELMRENIEPRRPFELVSMDFVTHTPESARGNTFLLLFQDSFSGYIMCKPMPSTTAQDVAEAYEEQIFRRFGASSMIRHDQDPRFMSEVFTRFRELLGSKQRAALAYRPQANGQQERSVQTVIRSVKAYLAEADQSDWDEHAERLMFALNTSFDATRLDTPFYLVNGWDAQGRENLDLRWVKRTRTAKCTREYLVKWKGYDDPDWTSASQLSCGALLYEFNQGGSQGAFPIHTGRRRSSQTIAIPDEHDMIDADRGIVITTENVLISVGNGDE